MNPKTTQTSQNPSTPASSGFPIDLVITAHHNVPHREVRHESTNGHVLFFETPASVAVQTGMRKDHCVCFVPLATEGRCFLDGVEIPAGGYGISPSGRGALFRSETAGIFAGVWISNKAAKVFCEPKVFHAMHRVRTFPRIDIPAEFRAFPDGNSDQSEFPSRAQEIESVLLRGLSEDWNSGGMSISSRRNTCRPAVVHEIWNGVRTAPADDNSLLDWSRRVGTSMRTVELAFREITGHAPVRFLNTVRYAMSRKLLLQNQVKTVSEAARQCGLTHLGRFSVDYRLKFGERPSTTLAKARDAASRNP